MGYFGFWVFTHLLLLIVPFHSANSQTPSPSSPPSPSPSRKIIEQLPGYDGTLPFKLETGYVSVGEADEIQLFYYFVESEMNPDKDPLVLWLTGGPGCSAFSGLVFEIGPLLFDYEAFDGSFPSFVRNPYSWSKVASFIFLDAPVGTGFSYSTTSQGYSTSDTKTSKNIYDFLVKWLLDHPKFIKNNLYVAGDSYSGKLIPLILVEISEGNKAESPPHISLAGYILGNPGADQRIEHNFRIPYYRAMGLISDTQYKLAESSCNGEYFDPDPNNGLCMYYLRRIKELVSRINDGQILEPRCDDDSPVHDAKKQGSRLLQGMSTVDRPSSEQGKLWCRVQHYSTSYVWANDPNVRQVLGIRNGTVTEWKRCNKTLTYVSEVRSVVEYHQLITRNAYRALIYSGDHDTLVPYTSTLDWIGRLDLNINEEWRPWFVDGQVAGFTEKYQKDYFSLTFATIKGGGHTAPEYNPKECFAMMNRWFSYYQL